MTRALASLTWTLYALGSAIVLGAWLAHCAGAFR